MPGLIEQIDLVLAAAVLGQRYEYVHKYHTPENAETFQEICLLSEAIDAVADNQDNWREIFNETGLTLDGHILG